MRQRHAPRHGDLAAIDRPHIRDGVMGGATLAGRDECDTVDGEAVNAMDARGFNRASARVIAGSQV